MKPKGYKIILVEKINFMYTFAVRVHVVLSSRSRPVKLGAEPRWLCCMNKANRDLFMIDPSSARFALDWDDKIRDQVNTTIRLMG